MHVIYRHHFYVGLRILNCFDAIGWAQGVDPGGWGGLDPRKYVAGVGVCFAAKMSHSFVQNCCWITLQV